MYSLSTFCKAASLKTRSTTARFSLSLSTTTVRKISFPRVRAISTAFAGSATKRILGFFAASTGEARSNNANSSRMALF